MLKNPFYLSLKHSFTRLFFRKHIFMQTSKHLLVMNNNDITNNELYLIIVINLTYTNSKLTNLKIKRIKQLTMIVYLVFVPELQLKIDCDVVFVSCCSDSVLSNRVGLYI